MVSATPDPSATTLPSTSRQYQMVLIEERQLVAEGLALGLRAGRPDDVIKLYSSVFDWLAAASYNDNKTLVLMSIGHQNIKDAKIRSALSSLKDARPEDALVVMGDDDSADAILGALELGAKGYIPTNVSIDVAIEAIILVAVGGKFVPASSLISACGKLRAEQPAWVPNMKDFTSRQIAVVDALRQGKANKIIAYELNMRESTVKVHVRNIMRKLKAKNRTEVAFIAHSGAAASSAVNSISVTQGEKRDFTYTIN